MIRSRVAEKLAWLGARCDPAANNAASLVISPPHSEVALYVVPTDEELMIARHTLSLVPADECGGLRQPRAKDSGHRGLRLIDFAQ